MATQTDIERTTISGGRLIKPICNFALPLAIVKSINRSFSIKSISRLFYILSAKSIIFLQS